MGQRFLIDTNILIYVLANNFPKDRDGLVQALASSYRISIVTKVEMLSYGKLSDSDMEKIRDFVAEALVYFIDESIADKTIEIRKKHGLKLPDAFIAATALQHSLTLVTRNEKDFEKITGLTVWNPYKEI